MRAEDDYDGRGLVLVPIFLSDDAAVVSWRNESANSILALPLDPVGPHIDPVGLWVPVDVHTACAYIGATIQFMPLWGGKDRQVDIIAGGLIFHHRSISNLFNRIICRFGLD